MTALPNDFMAFAPNSNKINAATAKSATTIPMTNPTGFRLRATPAEAAREGKPGGNGAGGAATLG
jgi:hypothetical protein